MKVRRTKSSSPILARHDYHDHANDPICEHPKTNTTTLQSAFPMKLYEMLSLVEDRDQAHIVSWQPHGRCFVVHDPAAFKELLPNYFKLSKLASFQRQLNLYGFQRLTAGLDKNGYYHEYFLRGRPDLVHHMQRVKVKGTGVRAKANPDAEPNLYGYTAVSEIPSAATKKGTPDIPVTPTSSTATATLIPAIPTSSANIVVPMTTTSSSNRILSTTTTTSANPTLPKIGRTTSVNFEKLIDEMFRHDQSLQFTELVKLATV